MFCNFIAYILASVCHTNKTVTSKKTFAKYNDKDYDLRRM